MMAPVSQIILVAAVCAALLNDASLCIIGLIAAFVLEFFVWPIISVGKADLDG